MWNKYLHVAMSSRYKLVVQGEASETDSDDEVYITSMPPPPQAASVGLKVVLYSKPFLSKSETVYLLSLI